MPIAYSALRSDGVKAASSPASILTMLLFLLDFLEDKAEALIIPLWNPGSG